MKIEEHPSPNHSLRKSVSIDTIVIHATGSPFDSALAWLCDPKSGVSAHYLIGKDGRIMRLVPPAYKAWHAGKSHWDGEDNVNEFSIGIELENANDGVDPYPDAQLESLANLVASLRIDWTGITHERIISHAQIAPGRKTDPGIVFPWVAFGCRLAQVERGMM